MVCLLDWTKSLQETNGCNQLNECTSGCSSPCEPTENCHWWLVMAAWLILWPGFCGLLQLGFVLKCLGLLKQLSHPAVPVSVARAKSMVQNQNLWFTLPETDIATNWRLEHEFSIGTGPMFRDQLSLGESVFFAHQFWTPFEHQLWVLNGHWSMVPDSTCQITLRYFYNSNEDLVRHSKTIFKTDNKSISLWS